MKRNFQDLTIRQIVSICKETDCSKCQMYHVCAKLFSDAPAHYAYHNDKLVNMEVDIDETETDA